MELSDKLRHIEEQVDRMIQVVGTKNDIENFEEEERAGRDGSDLTEKNTISDLLLQIRNSREAILQKKDFSLFHEALQSNRALIENFSTFAATAVNIRDKVKILFMLKNDLQAIKNKVDSINQLSQRMEVLNSLKLAGNNRFSEETLMRFKKLSVRAQEQNLTVSKLLDSYEAAIDLVNQKLIRLSQK